MGQLAGTIAKLTRLKSALSNVRPFYIRNLPRWRERAERITVAVLINLRPEGTDAEVWQRRVATEASRVAALLSFDAEMAGAIISLGIAPTDVPVNDPRHYTIGSISVDDVVRWVESGREKVDPEAPGKNLDERDAGKSDLQIAWRVLWAIKLQKEGWEKLSGHILDFIGAEEQDTAAGYYGEILQAWVEQLGPEIREEFRWWVSEQVKQAMS
jgi:hypothetical protein